MRVAHPILKGFFQILIGASAFAIAANVVEKATASDSYFNSKPTKLITNVIQAANHVVNLSPRMTQIS